MSQPLPKPALCILHVEDNPADRELVQELFRAEGLVCQFHAVDTRAAFEAVLEKERFDVVLSDYSLPGFDGMTALALAQQRRGEVPFIFISGVMGEERAIESLKNGATDYVLKQRIERLVPSVRRALREVVEREQLRATEQRLRQSEEQLRQITENVSDWILVFDAEGRCTYANPACQAACEVPPGGPCPDFGATWTATRRPACAKSSSWPSALGSCAGWSSASARVARTGASSRRSISRAMRRARARE